MHSLIPDITNHCGLDWNVPQRLMCLDTWFQVGDATYVGLKHVALMEEVCHLGRL